MQRLKQWVLHPYFSYFYLFAVVFCVVLLLALPPRDPFVFVAIALGVMVFILQRYRKRLLSKKKG